METPAPATPPAEKKTPLALVITSTPVILAVIATFILGQSSSEMTKAQYQRAVAGQKQSKVSNQWDFFQAKRIRGTQYESTAVVLAALKAERFAPEDLEVISKRLVAALEERLKSERSDALEALLKKAEAHKKKVDAVLADTNVKMALAALDNYPETPEKKDNGNGDKEQNDLLTAILDDVKNFKPEHDIAPKTLGLKTETIDKAMVKAKARTAETSQRGEAIHSLLKRIDALVDNQVALGREYDRVALTPALVGIGADPMIRTGTTQLLANYKAARFTFDARRYKDDAESNQEAAYLYDVYVLQSSARSDRHLSRSFGFMIAMLAAQVGVTIGTLALTMRWKVPAWLIAVLAGLSALALGAYVYLEMGSLSM